MPSCETYSLKALFGGTFDPPHAGHLLPLLSVLDTLQIETCDVIPSHIPVHKRASSNAQHRLRMTELFVNQDKRLVVNDIEILRATPSYSVDTIRALADACSNHALVFIMGLDSFLSLHLWRSPAQFLSKCHVVVMMRADDQKQDNHELSEQVLTFLQRQSESTIESHMIPGLTNELVQLLPAHLHLVDNTTQNAHNDEINGILRASKQGEVVFFLNEKTPISSSMIRQSIADGVSIDKWLAPEIAKYIQAHRIYDK